jgi:hypothetical protein
MIRKIALSLTCVSVLALGACRHDDNGADRRERAMYDDSQGVWFNGNGERVARAELTTGPCDDWCSAGRPMSSSEDMYSSQSSDRDDYSADRDNRGAKAGKKCGCDKGRTSEQSPQ